METFSPRQLLPGVLVAIISLILTIATYLLLMHFLSASSELELQSQSTDQNQELTGSYLASGDVFWGRAIDLYAKQSPLKYDWPFSRLSDFNRANYDGWITDLECPVTTKTIPYQVQVDSLVFSCSPDYLASAKKWFDVFTLANNHTDNTGRSGFTETQQNLVKAGLQFFGHYDLSQKDDLCEVVSLDAKLGKQKVKLPIAMCGYHWLAREPTDEELSEISHYATYFPVWVFAHGGTEYAVHSTPQQGALYRKMIDLGADAIFGDHPHVVENTEAYKGKLIVYNFGNLIYDQWFDNEVTKLLIVSIKVSAKVDDNLKAYLKMADACLAFKDDCLARAQSQSLKAYKLNYSYDILCGERSSVSMNDRLTHKCTDVTYQWLLGRTNWQITSAGLIR